MDIDEGQVEEFANQVFGTLVGAVTHAMVVVGDELGLYRALATSGPVTPAALAAATDTHERYVREWLLQQAAVGFVTYDDQAGTFALPPEHAAVLAFEDSPAFLAPAAQLPAGMFRGSDRLVDAFRTGEGIGWDQQDPIVFTHTERFWRAAYRPHLTSRWLPALDGVVDRLRAGARVADVGCGHGAAAILMAEAYPASRFVGFDLHAQSIETARERAADAGVGDRVRFEVADAADYPADGYDLITFFDTLHDLGDPVGAAAYARSALAPDGSLLLVELRAEDDVAANLATPGAAVGYAASTFLCTPNSLSQPVGLALGSQAGEQRLRDVLAEAGCSHVGRVDETLLNAVYEVRP
ncbi:MAG: class I SAM-dependent methyltransferase [Thermocrispum sp.]